MPSHKQLRCPLLEKFFIVSQQTDWERAVCVKSCPLDDLCIFDLEGSTALKLAKKTLSLAFIPCPKCQTDPVWVEEIRKGVRLSNLRPDEDGWKCWDCAKIIYRDKPLPIGGNWGKRREKK